MFASVLVILSPQPMALAFIVTLEKDLPESAAYVKAKSGRALAREVDRLDLAARTNHVAVLTSLLSESTEALAAQMRADGFDPSKMRLPPEKWHAATDGLKSIRGISQNVAANLNNFKQPNPILRDLQAAETLLVAAEKAGVRFHFTKANL
jgi:hypothetical protein